MHYALIKTRRVEEPSREPGHNDRVLADNMTVAGVTPRYVVEDAVAPASRRQQVCDTHPFQGQQTAPVIICERLRVVGTALPSRVFRLRQETPVVVGVEVAVPVKIPPRHKTVVARLRTVGIIKLLCHGLT